MSTLTGDDQWHISFKIPPLNPFSERSFDRIRTGVITKTVRIEVVQTITISECTIHCGDGSKWSGEIKPAPVHRLTYSTGCLVCFCYPLELYSLFQHYVFELKDKQTFPVSVTTTLLFLVGFLFCFFISLYSMVLTYTCMVLTYTHGINLHHKTRSIIYTFGGAKAKWYTLHPFGCICYTIVLTVYVNIFGETRRLVITGNNGV